jgi:hypothetical protein
LLIVKNVGATTTFAVSLETRVGLYLENHGLEFFFERRDGDKAIRIVWLVDKPELMRGGV